MAVFFGDFHELDADHGPILRLHNRVNDGHALILQREDCGSDHLAFVERVEISGRNESGFAFIEPFHDGLDVDAVKAKLKIYGLIGKRSQTKPSFAVNVLLIGSHDDFYSCLFNRRIYVDL